MKQKVIATAMIKRANRTRYADVIANMRREYSCGLNTYPTTIEQARNILNKYEALFKLKQRLSGSRCRGRFNNDNDNETQYGLQYSQDNNLVPGINGKINAKIKCFECNRNGHYTDQCPTRQEHSKGEQHVQETINNDDNTVISEDNNIETGQQHIQTTEVLHDEDSAIVDDNERLEDYLLILCFIKKQLFITSIIMIVTIHPLIYCWIQDLRVRCLITIKY